jgi:hypothetical protein
MPLDSIVPATVLHNYTANGFLFQVVWSANNHPRDHQEPTTEGGDLFYKLLIGSDNIPYANIAAGAGKGGLTITCAGYHDDILQQASATVSFQSNGVLFSLVNPAEHNCSKYRAELIGIMMAMRVLHDTERLFSPRSGRYM